MTVQIVPQETHPPASALCSMSLSPLRLTGFLVQHFQRHFTNMDAIGIAPLRQYTWDASPDRSRILVASLTRWDPQAAGVRPAVLIRRNDWNVSRIGINDALQSSTILDGSQRYEVLMSGSYTLFALSVEAGEAEELGFEVMEELLGFGKVFREKLDLARFIVTQIGRPQLVLESREHFGVPITVAHCHTYRWVVRQQAPRLHSFDVTIEK